MDVIPAVDVLDGIVVRLERGDFDRATHYGTDPVATALGFGAAGASLVHVVDLGGARSGIGDPTLWEALGAAGVVFQAAGGIRTADTARAVLEAGAERIVVGTTAVWDPHSVALLATLFGEELVVALDVKDGRAVGAGWEDAGRDLDTVLAEVVGAGVMRLMVTATAGDGMLSGPDLGLLQRVIDQSGIPVIASGGVGTLDDVAAVARLGAEAVVIGRALYEGRFTLPEAITAAAG